MRYEIALLPAAQEDLAYWKANSPQTVKRIARLLQDMAEHPFTGVAESLSVDPFEGYASLDGTVLELGPQTSAILK